MAHDDKHAQASALPGIEVACQPTSRAVPTERKGLWRDVDDNTRCKAPYQPVWSLRQHAGCHKSAEREMGRPAYDSKSCSPPQHMRFSVWIVTLILRPLSSPTCPRRSDGPRLQDKLPGAAAYPVCG